MATSDAVVDGSAAANENGAKIMVAETGDYVMGLQGFASFCEAHKNSGGIEAADCDMLAAKFRDCAFVVDQFQKFRDRLRTELAKQADEISDLKAIMMGEEGTLTNLRGESAGQLNMRLTGELIIARDKINDLTKLANQYLGWQIEAAKERDQLESALKRLITTAALLQANSEGCAVNHYGEDFSLHGMPGWLADCQKDIDTARIAVGQIPATPTATHEAPE